MKDLQLEGPFEDFLRRYPWIDLLAMLHGGTRIWITDDVCLTSTPRKGDPETAVTLDTSTYGPKVHLVGPTVAALRAPLESILMTLAYEDISTLDLSSSREFPLPCSPAVLDYVCSETTARVSLEGFDLDSRQCRSLATYGSISLAACGLESAAAFPEMIRNATTQKLHLRLARTRMTRPDFLALCAAISESQQLRTLQLTHLELDDDLVAALVQALATSKGISWLDLRGITINDECWYKLCKALERQKDLKYIGLANTNGYTWMHPLSTQRKLARTKALWQAIRSIPDLYSIHISSRDHDAALVEEIDALLLRNRHRPRADAVARLTDARSSVLTQTLALVGHSPDLIWLFLQKNMDVLFLK